MSNQIIGNNADDLFDKVIDELCKNKSNVNDITYEIINANLVLTDPTRNTMCKCKRNMPMRYAIGELLWYLSTNRSAKSIAPFSKFWQNIADEDGNVNSNYGYCIHKKFDIDQWEIAKQLLLRDESSRQAVIHIKEPRNLIEFPTKDVNCTLTLQFLIRNNKLDLIVNMRSNDVWLGLPYDLFNFTCMQIRMAMELGVDVGTYYHNVGSLHMYNKDVVRIGEGNADNS